MSGNGSAAPRALIIGGSVGGLLAACLLREIGWDVAVFEKSTSDLSGRGAGVGLSNDLFDVMRRVGAEVNPAIGVPLVSMARLDRSGAILSRKERRGTAGIWSRVYKPLRAVVPDALIAPGRTLERVTQDDGRVVAHFADGGTETGDLLLGCDGGYSTVRRQYLPEATLRYAGYVAWRGIVEERLLSPETHALLDGTMVYVFPPGEICLAIPNPGRGEDLRVGHRSFYIIWFRQADADQLRDLMTDASGHDHGFAIPPPLIRPDVISRMRRDAKESLPPIIADIMVQTQQPLLQPITDLQVPRMVFGRVALLGDAAFVARPHVAAGITKAALDASTLAEELAASPTDVSAALARYEAKRLASGQELVERSRQLGAAALAPDASRDPERVMHDYGPPEPPR